MRCDAILQFQSQSEAKAVSKHEWMNELRREENGQLDTERECVVVGRLIYGPAGWPAWGPVGALSCARAGVEEAGNRTEIPDFCGP